MSAQLVPAVYCSRLEFNKIVLIPSAASAAGMSFQRSEQSSSSIHYDSFFRVERRILSAQDVSGEKLMFWWSVPARFGMSDHNHSKKINPANPPPAHSEKTRKHHLRSHRAANGAQFCKSVVSERSPS